MIGDMIELVMTLNIKITYEHLPQSMKQQKKENTLDMTANTGNDMHKKKLAETLIILSL